MSWEQDYGAMIGIPYIDTSYDQPRTPETIVTDVATQRQAVSGTADAWGGFWTGMGLAAGKLLDYGIKRDAAITGVKLQTAAQTPVAPVYQPAVTASRGGVTISPTVLIVGGLVALLVLKK